MKSSERKSRPKTYSKGTLPSTGIPYVIVNGTIVVKNSEVLKGVNPGQPIRFERVESRFKPLSIENWTKRFYAARSILEAEYRTHSLANTDICTRRPRDE